MAKSEEKMFDGSKINGFWSDGFGSFTVSMKDGTDCKISSDNLKEALKRCSFKGTLAKKYYHLEVNK